MNKRTLCFDFDGVLHSYTSGWQGARVISDPPVPGALEFLVEATEHFDVCILSSRSHQWGGRRAMKKWLARAFMEAATGGDEQYGWLRQQVAKEAFGQSWKSTVAWYVRQLLRKIAFLKYKPPAFVTVDDRAIQFTGTFPTVGEIQGFRTWQKQIVVKREGLREALPWRKEGESGSLANGESRAVGCGGERSEVPHPRADLPCG